MKPMYFKLCHNPENKTLAIPRAALQLSGLADAEELILHTAHLCSSSWRYSARKGRNFPSVRTPLTRKMKWMIPA